MSTLKSKHVELLWLGTVIFLVLFARTYSVHANPDAAEEAMSTIRPEAIRADMRFLSDDALEGRGTGSRGYDIAAKFMASQFELLGLQPAGDNGSYFQSVPLRLAKADEVKTTVVLERSGKNETLTFRKDYISHGDPDLRKFSRTGNRLVITSRKTIWISRDWTSMPRRNMRASYFSAAS
jgi:hypothetical protein